MDNITVNGTNESENKVDIGEQKEENNDIPIIIEKKPCKKCEHNSTAQLESLRRGREKMLEKNRKKREEKMIKNDAVSQNVLKLLEQCNMIEK